jgi:DNA-binding transcriptional LysR family regulator
MARLVNWENQIGRRLRLRDLHVLFMVVQHGSMAKAAAELGISQPAVSDVIANLEHALGVRLLDRGPQGVEPTMYGRALVKRSVAAFGELKQGIRDIEFLADPTKGEVKIGSPETLTATILLPVIKHFRQRYPHVALHVDEVISSVHGISGLRDRNYDLTLARLATPLSHAAIGDDLDMEVLFNDSLVVVAGMQTRWASRRKIDLAELIDEPWMLPPPTSMSHSGMVEALRARGLDMPKIAMVTFSVHLRTELVANGQFITALPKTIADRYGLKVLPIDLATRPRSVAMFTLKNRTLSPVVERFIEHVRECTRPMRVTARNRSSRQKNGSTPMSPTSSEPTT